MEATTSREGTSTTVTLVVDTAITADGALVPRGDIAAVRLIGPAGRSFPETEAIAIGLLDADGGAKPIDGPEAADEDDDGLPDDLADYTRPQLFARAKDLGLEHPGNISNKKLIDAIENDMAASQEDG